jgi:hypothetical protein
VTENEDLTGNVDVLPPVKEQNEVIMSRVGAESKVKKQHSRNSTLINGKNGPVKP